MERPTAGLSQQSGEAGGSLTLEAQGSGGSSPDNDGTGRHRQTARVLEQDGSLRGHIYFHLGDDSSFRARRAEEP